MAAQIIPLDNSPNQTFAINVNIDGGLILSLVLVIRFNSMAGYWVMKILDTAGRPIIDSVPLLTGAWPAANLLEQYSYKAIGSAYILNIGSSPLDYPDSKTLGSDFVLLWADTAGAQVQRPFSIGQPVTGNCGQDLWKFNELVAGSGNNWTLEFAPDKDVPGVALWLFTWQREFGSVQLSEGVDYNIVDNRITTLRSYSAGPVRAFYRYSLC